MTLQITGKHIDLGMAFQEFAADRLDQLVSKYVSSDLSGHVRVEKERGRFLTNCSVALNSGLNLEAHGEGGDAYASAENAFEKIEKRLRRYRRKLKDKHHGNGHADLGVLGSAIDYTIEGSESDKEVEEDAPVIVAETQRSIRSMSVSDAVMFLEFSEEPVMVFKNAKNGVHNIVYRRADGHIGWIDLSEETSGATTLGNET